MSDDLADRRHRAVCRPACEVFARQTSYLPFVAILQGRNRLVWRELPWLAMGLGLAAFALVTTLHACLIDVPAL